MLFATPAPHVHGAHVRLVQLLCCALVAWTGIGNKGAERESPIARVSLDSMQPGMQPPPVPTDTTLQAVVAAQQAQFGWSSVEVIVRRNDTLDQIFRRLELSLADLADLRSLAGLKAMLDRLHPGEALTLAHRDGALMALVRKLSPSETLVVHRDNNGFRAEVEENPLEHETRTTRGVITSSLFEAASQAGLRDQTALKLADLFGWDIDFVLDIQSGDEFTVTYDKLSQDGEYVGDGAIIAARFVNQGREYHAVRYTAPDGIARYYTADGRSLRKAFLRAPLEFSRISSRFNLSRRHPILNKIRAHRGVDYAAPTGTPVRAAGNGRVLFRGQKGGYGNVLELSHANGVVTVYGHLSRFAKGLSSGNHVDQGEVVAYVGMSGLATGPHLHYEYRVNGVFRNPQTVSLPDPKPLDEALRTDFRRQTAPLLAALQPATPAANPPAVVAR
ncbi:MAG: peptidoglycan DD-metalloendopeptidase family protein [Steroidobacteraceae bacterium]